MSGKSSFRPVYHASVPSGWSNDPNGLIYYNGKAHLFFQHYPYKPEWGTMHWGHLVTEDLVHWTALPVAIRPDRDYEILCGCCSGSSIEKDGRLYLLYTAAQPELQRQCLAVSHDGGITFEKEKSNPILTAEMLSQEVSPLDFRDPRLFEKDGWFYFIAGARVLEPEQAVFEQDVYFLGVAKDRLPKLLAVHRRLTEAGNVCRHFHLSLQSGCDRTLKAMNRKYDTAFFLERTELLRRYFPGCALTADLIAGFPGETEEDQTETLAFIRRVGFADIHVFPYSRRPGTPADKMSGQCTRALKARRAHELQQAADEMHRAFMDEAVGQRLEVLFETEEKGVCRGHSDTYLPVSVPGTGLRGQILSVRIEAADPNGLKGSLA